MKQCFKCKKEKKLTEFYKHPMMGDGYLGKCKECAKLDVRKNRGDKADYYRAYDSARAKRKDRKNDAAARTKARRKALPAYLIAHSMVARALKNGILQKENCKMCGSGKFIHAHHDDYHNPLDVMWLCPVHHKARHAFLDSLGLETF